MWLKNILSTGSPKNSPDSERENLLIQLLEENNKLLRLQLQQSGVPLPASARPPKERPFRKYTERDVLVMTREKILAHQLSEREKRQNPKTQPESTGSSTGFQTEESRMPSTSRSDST